MRFPRLAALLGFLVLPATVVAADYQALRAANPSIERAVAAMPSSAVNGDLNRISSLLSQAKVQAYVALPDRSLAVPTFIDRPLVAALEDLGDDLEWGLSPLDFADTMAIAQVVNRIAVGPTLVIYEPPGFFVGSCTVGFPTEGCSPARQAVARIVSLIETKARAEWSDVASSEPSLPAELPPPTDLQPNEFSDWVAQCLDAPGVLSSGGAESIDD